MQTSGMKLKPTQAQVKQSLDQLAKIWKPIDEPHDCYHCIGFVADRCQIHGDVPMEFRTTVGQCDDFLLDDIPW